MNADRLLELYEQISDASDAIARLRDVVLEVGVRGKLNEQDEAETVSPEFLNETTDPEFPANWRTLNFGKYCNIEGGNQPPKSQFVDSPRDGYVRLFQIRDLGERPVPVFIPETSTKRFSVDGEILIGRYGASVGKVFWAQNGAYNVALAKFIFPESAFLPDFAFRLLKSSFFQKALEGASRTAQAGFNKGDLAHIDFPLPPLAEQHRIVAKVDELMALCDQLEQARAGREAVRDRLTTASLARLTAPDTDADTFQSHARFALQSLPTLTTRPDQIKTLRQTILNLAVQGKLVEQDGTDEPAAELLTRIRQEKATLGIRLRPDVDDVTDLPFALPRAWALTSIGEVCSKTGSGSTPRGGKEVYTDKGVPFFRSQNIYDDGLRLDEVALISAEIHERMSGTAVKPADLLLNITGGSMGRCCRVPNDFDEANVSQHVAIIRPAITGMSDFLHRLVLSPYFQAFIFGEQTGAGRGGLPKNRMDRIAVALPPLAEQHRIVAKVDALMALCYQLEASLTTTATTRSKLLGALLHEALEPAADELEAAE
jgi:type I restriction enzyme S subunit